MDPSDRLGRTTTFNVDLVHPQKLTTHPLLIPSAPFARITFGSPRVAFARHDTVSVSRTLSNVHVKNNGDGAFIITRAFQVN